MPTSTEVRHQFIDFFVDRHAHAAVPSSPVVPHDDPTLLFTNAGMNQFKDVFLGVGSREYSRAVDTQKCIRAGGKHNDLEDVGRDTYHHTFFEMLGNWSFGDYFKKEAIDWAWELLVDVWKLDPARLHASYFEGDVAEGLEPDHEARDLWLRHLPAERVHPGNKRDNFWEMGDTGPCGPCSELHYDRTDDLTGGELVNGDDPRVIEVWNLVFIQFNRNADGSLTPLPARHVDTGMGFERIVAVLQGESSNYDTDLFAPLFAAIREATGARAYGGELEGATDTAYRVIADHVRCLTFAIADGAVPSNEGRGYVLRRILRRAARYGRQTLGVEEPFIFRLVTAVAEQLGPVFPELQKRAEHVAAVVREEEESFAKTLDRGITLFEEAAAGKEAGDAITAQTAFTLYDTFGFPLDLTQLMAGERGLSVDDAGFERLMEEARQRSRGTAEGDFDPRAALTEALQRVQGDSIQPTQFTGYGATEGAAEAVQVRVFSRKEHSYQPADSATSGESVAVVLSRTPFYAEGGGQVGDRGVLQVVEMQGGVGMTPAAWVEVEDTIKVRNLHFHLGTVVSGTLHAGEEVEVAAAVDRERRMETAANHTATHLMNHALRRHVNSDADQRGSLVEPGRLRFDFSHTASLTGEQVEAVEASVNEAIEADQPVYAREADESEARGVRGLRAVFGEKYPPRVRVVSVGVPVERLLAEPGEEAWEGHSIEFCGGTHLSRTGEAGVFSLVADEPVAKGVRRVIAVTGSAARRARADAEKLQARMERALASADSPEADPSADAADLTRRMSEATLPLRARAALQAGIEQLQSAGKQRDKQRSREAAADIVEQARAVADDFAPADGEPSVPLVARFDGADADALRVAMDVLRKRHPDAAVMLFGTADDKVALIAGVPQPLVARGLKAGDWIRPIAKFLGGGGGGRPDVAQAGGKDVAKVDEAMDAARAAAAELLHK